MAAVKPIYLLEKYKALNVLIIVLYVAAGLLGLGGMVALTKTGELQGLAWSLAGGCFIAAFNFVVIAQLITLFIELESNQRETNCLLEQIISHMPEREAIEEETGEGNSDITSA